MTNKKDKVRAIMAKIPDTNIQAKPKRSVFLHNRKPTVDITDDIEGGLNEFNKNYLECIDDHVNQQGECLIWGNGGRVHTTNGLPYINYCPVRQKDRANPPPVKSVPVNRVIWLVNKGEWLKEGKTIKNSCGNKLCCEPWHMKEVEQTVWDPNKFKRNVNTQGGNNSNDPF